MLKGMLELEAGNAYLASGKLLNELVGAPACQSAAFSCCWRERCMRQANIRDCSSASAAMAERADAPAYLLTLLARAHEDAGARDKAARYLDRAASLRLLPVLPVFESDPPGVLAVRWRERQGDAGIVVPYVRSLLAAQQTGEAMRVADRYRALFPQSSEAWVWQAMLRLQPGDRPKPSNGTAKRARSAFPRRGCCACARPSQRSGDGNQARELAARYLAAWPQSALAARLVASDAMAAGDWARSAAAARKPAPAWRQPRCLAAVPTSRLRSCAAGTPRRRSPPRGAPSAIQPANSALRWPKQWR